MEHLTQEFRVWRNPDSKEITRKEEIRVCKISGLDIQRMNKQNYGSSISGAAEFYYEILAEPIHELTVDGKGIDDWTVKGLKAFADDKYIDLEKTKKVDIMAEIDARLTEPA